MSISKKEISLRCLLFLLIHLGVVLLEQANGQHNIISNDWFLVLAIILFGGGLFFLYAKKSFLVLLVGIFANIVAVQGTLGFLLPLLEVRIPIFVEFALFYIMLYGCLWLGWLMVRTGDGT